MPELGRLLLAALVAAVLLLLAAEAVAGSRLDREEIELHREIEEIRFESSIREYRENLLQYNFVTFPTLICFIRLDLNVYFFKLACSY